MTDPSDYIRIESIESLDPNKFTLDKTKKRFVDKDGKVYGIRFNKENRRLEFVHLQMKRPSSVQKIAKEEPIAEKPDSIPPPPQPESEDLLAKISERTEKKYREEKLKRSAQERRVSKLGQQSPLDLSSYDLAIEQELVSPQNTSGSNAGSQAEFVDARGLSSASRDAKYLDTLFAKLNEIQERIHSIIRNLQGSKIFEMTGDPSENKNMVGNISREYAEEIFGPLEKCENFYKELTTYPRSISYYTGKFEKSRRDELASMHSPENQMEHIVRWEMQDQLGEISGKLKAMILDSLGILNTKNEQHIKELPFNQQQLFRDARTALVYASEDTNKLLLILKEWSK